jgi:hypothetical protein
LELVAFAADDDASGTTTFSISPNLKEKLISPLGFPDGFLT